MAEDRIGQQLGNYRLIKRLGEGGFAEVYQGEHIYLKTEAAIKVLHTRLATDDMDSFVSEAQTIARLKHPSIVRVLEFGVEGSTPFLVMDYAPNGTLRQRHRKGTRLDPAVILPYVKQVAEALQYAHDQKLVHRDVKPENMLIGERDEVLLSDFGIATVAQSSRYQGTQEVAGTVAYMAPEQVQGKPRPASDQYSLGIVIYEWLTGKRPFHGSFTEIATQHVLTPPPPLREKLPDIAPAIEEVVLTALAKDPKERFGSVRAFATAFEQACLGTALHFAPTQVITPSGPIARPTAIITPPASQPLNPSAPTPNLPSTIAVPPVRAPGRPALPPTAKAPAAGNNAPAVTSTPPGWKDVPRPAPSTPPARPIAARLPAPPAKEPSQPKQRRARRVVIAVSLVLVLAVITGGIIWQATRFPQQVTTGPDITSIHVGTGVDANSGAIQGETDTFHVGDTAYLAFTASSNVQPEALIIYLYLNNVSQGIDSPRATHQSGMYEDLVHITEAGVYQWEVDYSGAPEASITFQVVS